MSKTSIKPYRLEGESVEDYKKRRSLIKKAIGFHLKGREVWVPGASIDVPELTEEGTVKTDKEGNPITTKVTMLTYDKKKNSWLMDYVKVLMNNFKNSQTNESSSEQSTDSSTLES